MLDYLLVNGQVIDGTGNPPFGAAVGIRKAQLHVIRGNTDHISAGRVIDVSGHIVAPGFIDMHSHSGLVLLSDPEHLAKVRQGVTTEVIGVDGISYAPVRSERRLRELIRMNAGLDGDLRVKPDWTDVCSYLDRFDGGTGVNVALMVGNSALRLATVGWGDRPSSVAELADMKSMLSEAISGGAFGLSSGLDYPPGSYASTEELIALCGTLAVTGGFYHSHVRYQLGDRFLDPFREAFEIGRAGGSPVHITHLYRRTSAKGGASRIIDLVNDAVDEGLEVTFDSYPYEWSSTRLSILLPPWVQAGGPAKLISRLKDAGLRTRIHSELADHALRYGGEGVWRRVYVGNLSRPENLALEGKSVAEIADLRNLPAVAVVCELLLSEDLRVNQVAANPDPVSLPRFLAHPRAMVGTDSVFLGEKPSPRTFGSYPRILGEWVRDEGYLSLAEAVRKMTSFPAQRLGVADRGILRDGLIADVVVFNPSTVASRSTRDEPDRSPVGIEYVFVNGVPTLDSGEPTMALPGRSVRAKTHYGGSGAHG